MNNKQFDDFALDAIVDIAVTAGERAAKQAARPICIDSFATNLARRLVLEVFPMVRNATVTRNVVEAAGRDAALETDGH